MKAHALVPLLLVLTLTLTAKLACADGYTAGLGVSDHEAHPSIVVGQTGRFDVARVSNTGTLNLTVTSVYIPDDAAAATLNVSFTPNPVTLAPQENAIIYGEVTGSNALGVYMGKVEFHTAVALPENDTGNPSTPGGSAKVTINIVEVPPVAAFTWSPLNPSVNETASFDASGSTQGWDGSSHNPILSYSWDFGDGNTSAGKTASHAYSSAGNYSVTLNITDSFESAITSKQVEVREQPAKSASPSLLQIGFPIGVSGLGVCAYLYHRKTKTRKPPRT